MISCFPPFLGRWGMWGPWVQTWGKKQRDKFQRQPWVTCSSFLGMVLFKIASSYHSLSQQEPTLYSRLLIMWVRGWKSVRHISSIRVSKCSMFWRLLLAVLCPIISLTVVDLPRETNPKLTTQVLLAWLLPGPVNIILSSSDYKATLFCSYLISWTCA